ncbi:NAD(P)-dependent malic enzyme [Acetohalobium arabaticum]|uniref:Malic protein domain protein n=1 Tax=Acetohalobium arabaticum (strain ATCC 49924 / DSM 5501 / Z-7288) TaxID=574087 RepID=D9QQL4_ACEAZ|nr:malic enzyme-like NAD(P)-binding protein [Acetohalobium arabaticum]ADL12805.1 malic protein domain protein [Acetohalobium arabaticum DSM 5501]
MIIKEDALMGYETPEEKEKKEVQNKQVDTKKQQGRKQDRRAKSRTDFLQEIVNDPEKIYKYTDKGRRVAVISNGSSVLHLGEIGADAVLPIVESKVKLLEKYAEVEAVPICLDIMDIDKLAATIKNLAPAYGAIFLEDIAAPECIELQYRLQNQLSIPVYHDDQQGRAIAVLAALYNALQVVDKSLEDLNVVIFGSEIANLAIIELLLTAEVKEVTLYDKFGIFEPKDSKFSLIKKRIDRKSRVNIMETNLEEALDGADVLLGNGFGDILNQHVVHNMKEKPIIFSLADSIAKEAPRMDMFDFEEGEKINSQLVFPGLIKGLLQNRQKRLSLEVQLIAAKIVASLVEKPAADNILPNAFDPEVMNKVTEAVFKGVTTAKTDVDKLKKKEDLSLEVMEYLLD